MVTIANNTVSYILNIDKIANLERSHHQKKVLNTCGDGY